MTFNCVKGCLKVALIRGGSVIVPESSADDSTCQSEPFVSHPIAGDWVFAWVKNPLLNPLMVISSPLYPAKCYAKCSPAFAPGPAPNHTQMKGEAFSAGYAVVSCCVSPNVSLNYSCPNGADYILQY